MIYFRTCAYNAEKTLKRAVDSVLNQTYGEFTYYLLDNGSTDGTGKLIREYAQKDKRIVPFYNKQNRNFSENPDFWSLTYRLQNTDYFCVLDADDAYEPTFLEEMLKFLTENQLDMAACGTKFIDATSGAVCGERLLPRSLVLADAQRYDRYFSEVHWNLRQAWGKVYTAKAARARYETDLPDWFPKAYGGDTANVYECVKASERIGVYGKILHSYTVSQKSVSYKWIEGRENADVVLFEKAIELLKQKCGGVSERNLNFLYEVQFNAIIDTLNVLYRSDLSSERKISITKEIINHPVNKKALLYVPKETKANFLIQLADALLEEAPGLNEVYFSDFLEALAFVNGDLLQLFTPERLGWCIKMLPKVVRELAVGDYEHALNRLIAYCVIDREPNPSADYPFVLGQILSALCNEEKRYVFFSKLVIQWCLENNQLERAHQELSDWLQILPGDEEFKALNHKYLSIEH